MGGGKTKIPVSDYLMSIHFGICKGQLDSINKIYVKEKPVWCGFAREQTSINVDMKDLFGGDKKEGGVRGTMELFMGTADQTMTLEIASRYGRTPNTMPGYRGIGSVFFRGTGAGGFKWISNNPYLPGAWVNVSRIPKGLSNSFAEIYETDPEYTGGGAPGPGSFTDSAPFFFPDRNVWLTLDLAAMGVPEPVIATGTMTLYTNWTYNYAFPAPIALITDWEFYSEAVAPEFLIVAGYRNNPNPFNLPFYEHECYEDIPAGTRFVRVRARAWDDFLPGSHIGGYFMDTPQGNAILYNVGGGEVVAAHCGTDTMGRLADANPAHMIYEVLTDRDWGMGAPPSSIDLASFMYAAELFHTERFGLSIMWSQQSDIQSYVSEILDHVQANLFIDPRSGLWTLVPLRGDYDPDALPVLNPSNCKATNRQRKGLGETVNEIVVSWTNPNNEKEETITFQDLGSIAANDGEIISASRNYYGIRNAKLASAVGQRDLRSASYPMFGCDIVAHRSMSFLRPGSVAKLDWPEDGIVGMIVRVGKVDYGRPGEGSVKFPVTEDVFALDVATYTGTQTGEWVSPETPPTPMTNTAALTIPLPLLLRSGVPLSGISDDDYPSVFNGVLSDHETAAVEYFELQGPLIRPNGDPYIGLLGNVLPTASAPLTQALVAEPFTVMDEFQITEIANPGTVEVGDFIYLTSGSNDETSEVLMLDSFDGSNWTVARGMFDTVPRVWPIGTRAWFLGDDVAARDPAVQTAGVPIPYRLLTRTSGGTLPMSSAPVFTFTASERPYLPFRPANVLFTPSGGGAPLSPELPADPGAVVPLQYLLADKPTSISVAFSTRNRLSEDIVAPKWDAATVTPEAGQTTTIRLRDLDTDTVLTTLSGLTSSPQVLSLAAITGLGRFAVEVLSVRDGFESLQHVAQRIMVVEPGYGNAYGFAYAD